MRTTSKFLIALSLWALTSVSFTCAVDCSLPADVVPNASLNEGEPNVLTVTCDDGFVIGRGDQRGLTTAALPCDEISGQWVTSDADLTVGCVEHKPCSAYAGGAPCHVTAPIRASLSGASADNVVQSGALATVTCDSQYYLPATALWKQTQAFSYCCADGQFMPALPAACHTGVGAGSVLKDCAVPAVVNGQTDVSGTVATGAKVTVTCAAGFEISVGVSSSAHACENGVFQPVMPQQCTAVAAQQCSTPALAHATFSPAGAVNSGGSTTMACSAGFQLNGIGSATYTCANGQWSPAPADCAPVPTVVTCQLPSTVAHATFKPAGPAVAVDVTVVETCQAGFSLTGGASSATFKCLPSGVFNSPIGDCAAPAATCTLPVMANAVFAPQTASVNVGTQVTQTCASGYKLASGAASAKFTCTATGSFDATISECVSAQTPTAGCAVPAGLAHATFDKSGSVPLHAVVKQTCAGAGYVLRSGGTSGAFFCQDNHVLQLMTALQDREGREGRESGDRRRKREEDDERSERDGREEDDEREHAPRTCTLPAIANGAFASSQPTSGATNGGSRSSTVSTASTTTLVCNAGFFVRDASNPSDDPTKTRAVYTCNSGRWNTEPGTCVRAPQRSCAVPALPNSDFTPVTMVRNAASKAPAPGPAPGPAPAPSPTPTPSPAPAPSPSTPSSVPAGSSVIQRCHVGFALGGAATRTLTCNDGALSPSAADCAPNPCLVPTFAHASPSAKGWLTSGRSLTLACAAGYHLASAASSFTCTAGAWAPQPLDCVRDAVVQQSCALPAVSHATFAPAAATVDSGAHVTLKCAEGYETAAGGAEQAFTCSNGALVPQRPADCQRKADGTCPMPTLAHASVDTYSTVAAVAQGTQITVICADGYQLSGGPTADFHTCTAAGWAPAVADCALVQTPHDCVLGTIKASQNEDGSSPDSGAMSFSDPATKYGVIGAAVAVAVLIAAGMWYKCRPQHKAASRMIGTAGTAHSQQTTARV